MTRREVSGVEGVALYPCPDGFDNICLGEWVDFCHHVRTSMAPATAMIYMGHLGVFPAPHGTGRMLGMK